MGRASCALLLPALCCALAACSGDDAARTDGPDMAPGDASAGPRRDASSGAGGTHGAVDGGGRDSGPSEPIADSGAQMPATPASNLPDCGEWPPVNPGYPVIAACLGFEADPPPAAAGESTTSPDGVTSAQLEFRGEVIETGRSTPPAPGYCFDYERTDLGTIFLGMMEVRGFWLRVENADGARAVVGVLAPAFAWRLVVGDSVTVTKRSTTGGVGDSSSSRLEVRKATGELVAWFGTDGRVEQLQGPPEVALSLGERQCHGASGCFPSWARHALSVQLEGEDARSPLAYGQHDTFRPYVVAHGGLDLALAPGRCGQAQLDRAAAGIWLTPF